ncbi:mitochondrial carrier domain-containing protein [Blyttiomyces helicus]|uniref:Mitochondrial carrier domain-containing protein n=1 Tax=Blyttiomyces helicus TaxID=388810 RepID=A0A4P9W6N0_9FUNG|nr:mitochondrial carrier domain-containing protein [Blyttiomyces helicus]|eukprot:RKO87984.1 mitochondrial carrier domain-containing protein [Blyttiomyces helicus]
MSVDPPPPPLSPHPPRRPDRDKHSLDYVARSLLAGGIAGCAAKTVVAPLDRVKILFQTNNPRFEKFSGRFLGVFRAAKEIRDERGIRGLFQGHSATLLRIFPYAAIKFMAYEQLKGVMAGEGGKLGPAMNAVAGSLAGMSSVFVAYPLDLLRVRLAYEVHAGEAPTLIGTARTIYHEPNVFYPNPSPVARPAVGVLNFYRGFMPTIYGIIPYAGVSFLVYERLKTFAKIALAPYTLAPESTPTRPTLTWWAYLSCGAISGAVAQTSSYPFEVIRRHMQVAGSPASPTSARSTPEQSEAAARRTTFQTAQRIWNRKGARGFFVGLSIGYMKVIPMSAASFFVYEWMKVRLGID